MVAPFGVQVGQAIAELDVVGQEATAFGGGPLGGREVFQEVAPVQALGLLVGLERDVRAALRLQAPAHRHATVELVDVGPDPLCRVEPVGAVGADDVPVARTGVAKRQPQGVDGLVEPAPTCLLANLRPEGLDERVAADRHRRRVTRNCRMACARRPRQ